MAVDETTVNGTYRNIKNYNNEEKIIENHLKKYLRRRIKVEVEVEGLKIAENVRYPLGLYIRLQQPQIILNRIPLIIQSFSN